MELTEHLHESDVKCAALTHQCEALREQLQQQGDENAMLKTELERVMLSLKDSREELRTVQQAIGEGSARYESASSSYQAEIDRLTGELTVSEAVQAALRSENDQLKSQLAECDQKLTQLQSEMSDIHSQSVSEYQRQIAELQQALHTTETSYAAKVDELTHSLQRASDALATHLNEESFVIRNSEKLIAILEASLNSREKEVVVLTGQIKTLEARVEDLLNRAAAAEAAGTVAATTNEMYVRQWVLFESCG